MSLCYPCWLLSAALVCLPLARAAELTAVRGVVHDPQHRPIAGATVTLRAAYSDFEITEKTDTDGEFSSSAVPPGVYVVTAAQPGFDTTTQSITIASNTTPVLHFELQVASVQTSVVVTSDASAVNVESVTPTTLISREDIARTPGADQTNSLAMITDYVPGAYMTHDMLHMRGGHQLSWLIDGVAIPNTNIASNIAPQIDPKDIDYVEVARGSYRADIGDRTYGVFDVVPRTGFERNRQGELVLTLGNFYQTNDQLSLGNHSQKFAWYTSLNGNRSQYGLQAPIEQPVHDANNGYGGFVSLLFNRDAANQMRLVTQLRSDYYQIPYDPNVDSWQNQLYNSSGLRDGEHETDGYAAFTWVHNFNSSTLLQFSPFYHYNSAKYDPSLDDLPTATTSDQTGNYAGIQTSLSTVIAKNSLSGGIYGYGQHEHDVFGVLFNDGSSPNFSQPQQIAAGVEEIFVEDSYKPVTWLTLIGGMRQSHVEAAVVENAVYPRIGASVLIPKLNWVLRGFYGHFYQPPPLTSISGPVLQYANGSNTSFVPLRGERDEEHQFGLQIPFRGWLLDADTFETRANNFLDHSNVGESSIFIPVTVQGALIQGWELTLHSPRLWRYGQFHLAYSNQLAQQRGPITGGLICYPPDSPACAVEPGYSALDHDQRNTLNVGMNGSLPYHAYASFNLYYGSGFSNGYTDPPSPYGGAYLPGHVSADLAVGKTIGENFSVSVDAKNIANTRRLLDNSLTFGGFHYNDPRQIYGEVRYRFHF
ncbi:MAG TPA: TonB-dependent receptor [Acidobacteriaceae bacterium]|jgi:outer membrane cobalamin receptor|nr:TonB-dependent receptor [Acidobacteriaceae bacterium]